MTWRKPSFPEDWLLPNEFWSCYVCGKHVVGGVGIDDARTCAICMHKSPLEVHEALKKYEAYRKIKEFTAQERLDNRYPPFFWMKK